jgi:hypothetical protein
MTRDSYVLKVYTISLLFVFQGFLLNYFIKYFHTPTRQIKSSLGKKKFKYIYNSKFAIK